LVQWLHGTLLDTLGSQVLAIYVEVLQTMKAKVCQSNAWSVEPETVMTGFSFNM